MSQSRFSIVLVGVSALLRRPLVSRLRPADGERSPWVVFTARGDLPFRRLPLGGLVLPPPASGLPSASWPSGSRLPLSACTASGLPSAGWPSGSRLPLFGTHRFGVVLGGLAFGLTASAFRHAPLRSCPRRVDLRAHGFRFSARTASGLPSSGWRFRSAGWPSGSRLPLFGMRRSAPPCRRREGRRSTPTRHLFHFKTLISTC